MGNVSGREEKSGQFNQEDYYMEYGHTQAQVNNSSSSSSSSYPVHMVQHPKAPASHSQDPNQTMHTQDDKFSETSKQYRSLNQEKSIPAVINWIHGGTNVAIEGSWDNWKTRELLERSGHDFSIVKVLNFGVYHYRFVVDGQWTFAPELPYECDNLGNKFNILELKDYYPENVDRHHELECPSSPLSSYNNATFTSEDFGEKFPELPPLLQQTPLNQRSSSKKDFQKPLSANLNHLYIQRDGNNQPVVALSSTQRFRTKFVTTVLYKPFKKVKK
ncbi:SNF1-related protein kinase regulatory subunit beta-2-like [Rutidosis leptorrhynchoides]|uniref:SNF1-related protein kinase regulatory subunit beta-2-like n=1 Tax=Rutidosis leptorrhynchoides TaxID=125765 RepID=UPI003A99EB49